jgi:hypothetical protein
MPAGSQSAAKKMNIALTSESSFPLVNNIANPNKNTTPAIAAQP